MPLESITECTVLPPDDMDLLELARLALSLGKKELRERLCFELAVWLGVENMVNY